MSVDANLIESLRFQLELFIDGTDRTPEQAKRVAIALQEALEPDDAIDAFLTTSTIYGDPSCPFYRTEEEMIQECLQLRRHLSYLE